MMKKNLFNLSIICFLLSGCTVPTISWLPERYKISVEENYFGKWQLTAPKEIADGPAGFEMTLLKKDSKGYYLKFREPKSPPDKYPNNKNGYEEVQFYRIKNQIYAQIKQSDSKFIDTYLIKFSDNGNTLTLYGLHKESVAKDIEDKMINGVVNRDNDFGLRVWIELNPEDLMKYIERDETKFRHVSTFKKSLK